MSTDKRQFTLRIQDDTYEKVRYLAYLDRRSIAMEIEHILLEYIKAHEDKNGPIKTQKLSQEDTESHN